MITEEQIDLLVNRLTERMTKANTYFLQSIGSYIKQIKEISPSQAHQLVQMLKYGGSYEEIIRKIAEYSNMNIADIDNIFSNYAKKDLEFYKQFYEYRNIPFTEYAENEALKRQTEALANIVKNEMYNYARTNVLGYTIRDENGRTIFKGLRQIYNDLLDEALVNVGTGKQTFDSAMTKIMKEIGSSGLKTINYESGRAVRLDSTIRMHLKGKLRELHNENQKLLGDEFGADGVEISVHFNPAEDHELVQGRQFSNEEFEKLNSGFEAVDYKGNVYTLDHDHKNGFRPISEMNCYHYVFSIILGVNEPEFDDKRLKDIINSNEKGFEYEGKHYTNYQGTQLQRTLERAIREQKDRQILARASDNTQLIDDSQRKITILTNKYKKLANISGLPMNNSRTKISGYRRVATSKRK